MQAINPAHSAVSSRLEQSDEHSLLIADKSFSYLGEISPSGLSKA
jgi:hypothetical protein